MLRGHAPNIVTTVSARFRAQRHLTSARTQALYSFCCALALTQDFNCDIDSRSQEFISFDFLILNLEKPHDN
jgi:hypothetical protein